MGMSYFSAMALTARNRDRKFFSVSMFSSRWADSRMYSPLVSPSRWWMSEASMAFKLAWSTSAMGEPVT